MIARLLTVSCFVFHVLACGLAMAAQPAATDANAAAGGARSSRPNILFIFTDDHAAHAIGAYGSKVNKTPNIDRLAAEGMLFRNCFVTNSICGPSRAVILTGKYSHLNGFPDNRGSTVFDGSQQTFPKLLQNAGYQTAMIGKWHLKSDPTGFDYWNVLAAGGGQGTYYNPEMKSAAGVQQHRGYVTDIITDLSLDWLKRRDPNKPFMLMYQHKAPHREWEPGPKYLSTPDRTLTEPETLFDDYSGRSQAARDQEMSIARNLYDKDLKLGPPPKQLNAEQRAAWEKAYEPKNAEFRKQNLAGDDLVRWKYQRYMNDYLRCVASVDDNIGRVLEYLEQAGLDKNTIVVYSSDQGFYLGDHGWYDKRWMYEESLRTPFIVRWPGVTKPGSEDRHIALNLDFAETFLSAAGAKIPADMQGESLVPLLRGEAPADWRKSMYYHYYEFPQPHHVEPHYGVRTVRHKLIYYYRIGQWELFDLDKDPHELKSVYDDPAYAEIVSNLKTELKRLQEQYGDTHPETPPVTSSTRRALEEARKVKLKEVLRLATADQKLHRGFDPTNKPLTVGARCVPSQPDGVLAAQGGPGLGYALYLLDGLPRFAVRVDGELFEAVAPKPVKLMQPVHLAGMLDHTGKLHLFIDGDEAAQAPGALLPSIPNDGLSLGFDSPPAVGSYTGRFVYAGKLSDFRLYWGELDRPALASWSAGK